MIESNVTVSQVAAAILQNLFLLNWIRGLCTGCTTLCFGNS